MIVIDRSTDSTPAFFPVHFPSVSLIRGNDRPVPGASGKLEANRVQGDLIAFLDSDCEANPTWLHRLVTRIDHGPSHIACRVGVLYPRVASRSAPRLLPMAT